MGCKRICVVMCVETDSGCVEVYTLMCRCGCLPIGSSFGLAKCTAGLAKI